VYLTGGSNNIFEQCDAHHNEGPGFFIQKGGGNTFINCDSHENEDMLTSNGDGQSADGFGCHPNTVGDTGNVFHGCRAWWNSDDGWDFIHASEACTVEYSWAWYQGYKPDAIVDGKPQTLAAGNGNGFKAGGYDVPPTQVPANPPQHIVRFDVAFYNKSSGVYANHGPVNAYFYNNTSYDNGTDFDMLGYANGAALSVGMLRNNLAFGSTLTASMNIGAAIIDDKYNSWDSNMNLTVSSSDFQSATFTPPASCPEAYTPGGTPCCSPTDTSCFSGMASARGADGSLPVLPFLRLATGSKMIDKGVNVGLPYAGAAPDLGAFETGLAYDGADGGLSTDSGSSESGTSMDGSSSGNEGGSTDSSAPWGETGASGSTSGGSTGSGGSSTSGGSSSGGGSSASSGSSSGGVSSGVGGSTGGGTSSSTSGSSGSVTSSGVSGSSGSGASGATSGSSSGDLGATKATGGSNGCGCAIVGEKMGGRSRGEGVLLLAIGLLDIGRRRVRGRRGRGATLS